MNSVEPTPPSPIITTSNSSQLGNIQVKYLILVKSFKFWYILDSLKLIN